MNFYQTLSAKYDGANYWTCVGDTTVACHQRRCAVVWNQKPIPNVWRGIWKIKEMKNG